MLNQNNKRKDIPTAKQPNLERRLTVWILKSELSVNALAKQYFFDIRDKNKLHNKAEN